MNAITPYAPPFYRHPPSSYATPGYFPQYGNAPSTVSGPLLSGPPHAVPYQPFPAVNAPYYAPVYDPSFHAPQPVYPDGADDGPELDLSALRRVRNTSKVEVSSLIPAVDTVARVCEEVSRNLYLRADRARSPKDEIQSTAAELAAFSMVLENLHDALESSAQMMSLRALDNANQILLSCKKVLEAIEKIIVPDKKLTSRIRNWRGDSLNSRLAKAKSTRLNLESCKTTLTVLLSTTKLAVIKSDHSRSPVNAQGPIFDVKEARVISRVERDILTNSNTIVRWQRAELEAQMPSPAQSAGYPGPKISVNLPSAASQWFSDLVPFKIPQPSPYLALPPIPDSSAALDDDSKAQIQSTIETLLAQWTKLDTATKSRSHTRKPHSSKGKEAVREDANKNQRSSLPLPQSSRDAAPGAVRSPGVPNTDKDLMETTSADKIKQEFEQNDIKPEETVLRGTEAEVLPTLVPRKLRPIPSPTVMSEEGEAASAQLSDGEDEESVHHSYYSESEPEPDDSASMTRNVHFASRHRSKTNSISINIDGKDSYSTNVADRRAAHMYMPFPSTELSQSEEYAHSNSDGYDGYDSFVPANGRGTAYTIVDPDPTSVSGQTYPSAPYQHPPPGQMIPYPAPPGLPYHPGYPHPYPAPYPNSLPPPMQPPSYPPYMTPWAGPALPPIISPPTQSPPPEAPKPTIDSDDILKHVEELMLAHMKKEAEERMERKKAKEEARAAAEARAREAAEAAAMARAIAEARARAEEEARARAEEEEARARAEAEAAAKARAIAEERAREEAEAAAKEAAAEQKAAARAAKKAALQEKEESFTEQLAKLMNDQKQFMQDLMKKADKDAPEVAPRSGRKGRDGKAADPEVTDWEVPPPAPPPPANDDIIELRSYGSSVSIRSTEDSLKLPTWQDILTDADDKWMEETWKEELRLNLTRAKKSFLHALLAHGDRNGRAMMSHEPEPDPDEFGFEVESSVYATTPKPPGVKTVPYRARKHVEPGGGGGGGGVSSRTVENASSLGTTELSETLSELKTLVQGLTATAGAREKGAFSDGDVAAQRLQ
jgi:hypothetical protein